MKRLITISSTRAAGNPFSEIKRQFPAASILQSDGGNHFQTKVPFNTRVAGVIIQFQVAGWGMQSTTF
jgi:hypothetical protein